MDDLVLHALGPDAARRLHVTIHDLGHVGATRAVPGPATLVFDSAGPAPANPDETLHLQRLINIADRVWRIEIARVPAQLALTERLGPALVGLLGLALSHLLFGVLFSMSRARARALALAADMTRELAVSEGRFRALAEDAQDCVVVCNQRGEVAYVSPRVESMLGYTVAEVVGRPMSDLLRSDERQLVEYAVARAQLDPGLGVTVLHHARSRDGAWRLLQSVVRDMSANVGVGGMVFNCHDVTETERAQAALAHAEQRLKIALDASGVALWDYDLESGRIHLSARWNALLGEPPGETEISVAELVQRAHPDDRSTILRSLDDAVKGSAPMYRVEHRVRAADGSWLWIESVGSVVERDGGGRALRMAGSNIDVSERKRAEAQIVHLAFHDALTGLPNRRLLTERLDQAITQAERAGDGVALLMLNLEQFRLVNESLDRDAGDRLLTAVGQRLANCLRNSETLARLDADTFVVLQPRCLGAAQAAALGQRLLDALAVPDAPVDLLSAHALQVHATIGISLFPDDGRDVTALLRAAEAALAHGKASLRGQVHFHSAEITALAHRRLHIERELRLAGERGELCIAYQPLVDCASAQIVGAEALLRWQHPTLGQVSPAEFIPIAEACGLILPIGEWVLEQACQQARQWQLDTHLHFSIAVNLSIRQLAQAELAAIVERVLAETGLAPGTLVIELTESQLMSNDETTQAVLHRLKQGAGVRLVIDDFGTGYSNLSYLRQLQLDALKIDRSFVHHLEQRPDDAALIAGIVAIARALGLGVTAEGIETQAQYDSVCSLGCDLVQGFLIGRPMPAQALTQRLAEQPAAMLAASAASAAACRAVISVGAGAAPE